MSKINKITKSKMSIGEIFLRFFFGFLFPFVIINGLILFFFIQVPTITPVDENSTEFEDSKIKFSIDCILPIININTYFEDTEIAYSKLGNTYVVEANENGNYKIIATALNKASTQVTVTIETKDIIAPTINVDSATITSNLLSFTVSDEHSEINYDAVYATNDNGEKVSPIYIENLTGTIQFEIKPGEQLTVHIEDIEGNSTETMFVASE